MAREVDQMFDGHDSLGEICAIRSLTSNIRLPPSPGWLLWPYASQITIGEGYV